MIDIKEGIPIKSPGISSLFVSFKYRQDIVDIVKMVGGGLYDKKTHIWEFPITSLSELIDNLYEYDDIQLHFIQDEKDKKVNCDLGNFKTTPFEYQKDGIKYGLSHNNWLLLDPPGLGKTLQLIYIAQELKNRKNIEHCLIICGVNTLKTNWKKEIEKHSDLSCTILGEKISKRGNISFGSVQDRVNQLNNKIKEFFVITNIETLRDDRIVKAIQKGPNKFECMFVDEIHTCKSPTSQQGKHLLKLNKSKYKIGATGTLLMNNPLDAYVPLKWIGAEKANYTNFRYYYCLYGGQFGNELLGFKNLKTLKQQLNKFSLRRDKSLLKLPPKNIITEYVDMGDRQKKFYNDIQNGVIDEVDKVKLSPNVILSMAMRLRQATACPSILTTENIDSAKLDRAEDLCDQLISEGNKVVIFSTFKDSVYELEKRLQRYNPLIGTGDIKDSVISENIDKFQNEDTNKIFIGTWQKCGTGITLTKASYMIFIDTPWTASQMEQAEDRIYRIGTDKPVFIYNLITTNTVDERVLEIVSDKAAISDYIIDDTITEKSLKSLQKYIEELR